MKKVGSRSVVLVVLMALAVLGMTIFLLRYHLNAHSWIAFPGNPYTSPDGHLPGTVVTDRTGELLVNLDDGKFYSQDAALRKSTLHLVGDRDGNISTPVLTQYRAELAGFDRLSGVYQFLQEPGQMRLSISGEVQKAALAALGDYAGTIGVYNYQTGEILCTVTNPTWDPDGEKPEKEGIYLNRFFQSTFTPGSIFKLVTAAAVLENGVPLENATCQGAVQIGTGSLICQKAHGQVGLQRALAQSCNIYFGTLAQELGAQMLMDYTRRVGLLDSWSVDGIPVAAGQLTGGQSVLELAWAGVGQGEDLVNACSFLRFVGAIAGEGRAAEPRLVTEVTAGGKTTCEGETVFTEQLMTQQTAKTLQAYMRHNVETVYGQGNFGDLTVCAKSGTAEVGGGKLPNATFAGFVADPEYPLAFIVIAENAGSGSQVCSQMAAAVLRSCVQQLQAEGVSPLREP